MIAPSPPTQERAGPQEPEGVPGAKAARVAIFGVAVTVGAVFLVTRLLAHERGRVGGYVPNGVAVGASVTPRAIGSLEQTLIEKTAVGRELERRKRAELDRWGWADREHRVARVPIERAIDLVVDDPARH